MTAKRPVRKSYLILLFMSILLGLTPSVLGDVNAQSAGLNATDLSTVRSSDISDEQLQSYMARGKAEGLTAEEALAMAQQRGLPASQSSALLQRVRELESGSTGGTSEAPNTRQDTPAESAQTVSSSGGGGSSSGGSAIFGSRLFARRDLDFGPSFNVPTPVNYILGSGDEIIVDIWGATTNYHQLEVSTEGTVTIDNLGPIYVHGLTIEEASNRIIEKLKSLYRGLRPGEEDQTTFARVRLGRVRSIQVTLMGEVNEPGNHTVSSLSTVFNALYLAKGPNSIGSYRAIEVIRGNKKVASFDLYDFLINGDQSDNIRLQDQDIIKVSPFKTRVRINGEVKRPGLYEIMNDETALDLVRFAGNFTDEAFTKNVKIHRNTDSERRIEVLDKDQLASYAMKNGDVVAVGQLLDRFENRVTISGAVWRPGEFELTEGMTLHDLLMEAEGVRPDAFMSRGIINRLTPNFDFTLVSFNVEQVLNNPEQFDIPLANEDQVIIRNIHEMRQNRTVSIQGEVQSNGDYQYRDNMTLEDLILKAEGFRVSASEARIEVYRRIIGEAAPDTRGNQLAESFTFEVSPDLKLSEQDNKFELAPYDQVYVRRRPDYQAQQNVSIQGEVMYPGGYTLKTREERISDLVNRAGGLTQQAFIDGATLVRQPRQLQRIKTQFDTGDEEEVIERGSSNGLIGIDLKKIMENPGSKDDLYLRPGDVLRVPQELQTVSVTGAVLRDTEIRHRDGRGLNYYIANSGGYSEDALKGKAYVVYANGDVNTRKSFLFFRTNPKIEPGAEIIIPTKAEKERMSTGERISVLSSVVSMAAIVVTAIARL